MSLKVIFVFYVSTLATARVTVQYNNICSLNEFGCGDGACVSIDHLCDGVTQCRDGSDETSCSLSFRNLTETEILNRSRRQTGCGKRQWQCRDGSCIGFDGKCDGLVQCSDGSDESHALCRKTPCQNNWFRCTYGACVDGTAPCNGIKECRDNSDELLPRCRNETNEVRGQFRCEDGQSIPAVARCDGVADCRDGSDETVRVCAGKQCASYLFQCEYGACVDQGSDCNGKEECADGSDEADELCNKIGTGTIPKPSNKGKCILPPYPENGRYIVSNIANAAPGQAFDVVSLQITCNPGYNIQGDKNVICYDGAWSIQKLPNCIRFCKLNKHPSVTYNCILTGNSTGSRVCNDYEPTGTLVNPTCNKPNYYSPETLYYMHCVDGSWDYTAICSPECGKVTPASEQLAINGISVKHGELPWHVGIYKKTTKPFMQVCGGSLVSNSLIITAAHCFWTDSTLQPFSNYAVAAGKIYRPWTEPMDKGAQYSDISDIKVPDHFRGSATNFQSDIALVVTTSLFMYKEYVRPICISFDISLENTQLRAGSYGKVAGWGLTSPNGPASQVLKSVTLPYVPTNECIANSPIDFRENINSDKFCAGYRNGTALCKGDSGGGLSFLGPQDRYYLRGIVSTSPSDNATCNAYWWTAFTQITYHEHFIRQYLLS